MLQYKVKLCPPSRLPGENAAILYWLALLTDQARRVLLRLGCAGRGFSGAVGLDAEAHTSPPAPCHQR